MAFIKKRLVAAALAAWGVLQTPAGAAGAADQPHWVTTWMASPQALWDASFPLPTGVPASLKDQTVREYLRVSAGGSTMRLVFSNRYGKTPLVIGEVTVALASSGASSDAVAIGAASTGTALSFAGKPGVTVAPGALVLSDALPFKLAPLSTLAVSSYFPQATPVTTFHWGGQQTAHVAQGNHVSATSWKDASAFQGRAFLSAVLADAAPDTRGVVIMGDSITDGNGSTLDRNRRWPDFLAQRFASQNVAVANAGISGARMLGSLMGENALARFEQDVLAQPGVSSVVILLGINDIGWPGSPFAPGDAPLDIEHFLSAYRQLIERAHVRRLRVIGATLPPFEGALGGTPFEGHYSTQKEAMRQQVNHWIRHADAFDAVLDVDALLRDPAHPTRMQARYDSGDHLHPGDAGYAAIVAAVDLKTLFGPERRRPQSP